LQLHVSDAELAARPDLREALFGFGRQIFAPLRKNLAGAEEGVRAIFIYAEEE
jgi:hypothetical protein